MTEKECDDFQYWLMDMEDSLERFLGNYSEEIRDTLDYTPKSTLILEDLILKKYDSVEPALKRSEAEFMDGCARYIGEVFRLTAGCHWDIELDDPSDVYYDLPQVVNGNNQSGPIAPLSLATAALDRRTGHYIYDVLQAIK
jgi:hypothetical protein